MPEGPSIIILKEAIQQFKGKKVIAVDGNAKIDLQRIAGKKITDIRSWGKHTLICFKDFTLRIHLLMFGTYRINERKDAVPRLSLQFAKGEELNFYTCAIKMIEESLDEVYDWSADIMSDEWDPKAAEKKLKQQPETLACDALLDQNIFAGLGNIIKNEVLFRVRIHPESRVGAIPLKQLRSMINEVRVYAFQFLDWKKEGVLKKHWLAHTKKTCPRDHIPFHKDYLGKTHRRTFYCNMCEVLYK